MLQRLKSDERGQGLTEYILIVVLVGLAAVAAYIYYQERTEDSQATPEVEVAQSNIENIKAEPKTTVDGSYSTTANPKIIILPIDEEDNPADPNGDAFVSPDESVEEPTNP